MRPISGYPVVKVGTTREARDRARAAKAALPKPRETKIVRACLDLLLAHPKIAMAWRCNTGGMKNPAGRYVKFGFTGQPDIMAVRKGSGRLVSIEVKKPGEKPSDAQYVFLDSLIEAGGFGCWVTSVDELAAVLGVMP